MSHRFDLGRDGARSGGRLRASDAKTKLDCPCGEHIEGQDEDELVFKAKRHLADKHPQLSEIYDREHILFIGY